jgi:hypothetical protein
VILLDYVGHTSMRHYPVGKSVGETKKRRRDSFMSTICLGSSSVSSVHAKSLPLKDSLSIQFSERCSQSNRLCVEACDFIG